MESTATSIILKSWFQQVKRTGIFFSSLSSEDWSKEIAPGRNTPIYLLGHLIVASDTMIKLFGIGSRRYTDLDEAFMANPDKSGKLFPSPERLLSDWSALHIFLEEEFNSMDTETLLGRHNAMSDEDLIADPTRNKLSVLIGRTLHMNYHFGQLSLIHKHTKTTSA